MKPLVTMPHCDNKARCEDSWREYKKAVGSHVRITFLNTILNFVAAAYNADCFLRNGAHFHLIFVALQMWFGFLSEESFRRLWSQYKKVRTTYRETISLIESFQRIGKPCVYPLPEGYERPCIEICIERKSALPENFQEMPILPLKIDGRDGEI